MEWPTNHQRRDFWMVAREGGLRRAAETPRVPPPAIPAQSRELEAALGGKLFRRRGRGNVLTDAGQVALRHADESFRPGRELTDALRKGFPRPLPQAPALRPTESTGLRRSPERWFQTLGIAPRIVAEFEDAALMKVMASDGRGFIPVPSVVAQEAVDRFCLRIIGAAEKCRDQFLASTAERRIDHPGVAALTGRHARRAPRAPGAGGHLNAGPVR